MRIMDSDVFEYQSPIAHPPDVTTGLYQQPTYSAPVESGGAQYFSDPYVPYQSPPYIPPIGGTGRGRSDLDTGVQYFGLPYVTASGQSAGLPAQKSFVGPSVSIQPYANLRSGIPSGSLFSGRAYGRGLSSAGRTPSFFGRVPYQEGFTVDYQEQLRRRRRRGLFL